MIEWAPISKKTMSYDEAVLYCAFCMYNGHQDWRMPTGAEYAANKGLLMCWFLNCKCKEIPSFIAPVRDIA